MRRMFYLSVKMQILSFAEQDVNQMTINNNKAGIWKFE